MVIMDGNQQVGISSQTPVTSGQTGGYVPPAVPAGLAQPPVINPAQTVTAVGQAVQSGMMPPSMPPAAGSFQKEQMVGPPVPEKVPLVEVNEQEKVPEEVEGWMEKLEQAGEIKIPEAIKKDEQVILDNATPTAVRDTVVLPLSQQVAATAAKKKVSESARWLYEWCARLVKMLKDRARYANE